MLRLRATLSTYFLNDPRNIEDMFLEMIKGLDTQIFEVFDTVANHISKENVSKNLKQYLLFQTLIPMEAYQYLTTYQLV